MIDILERLKRWHAQLVEDAPVRKAKGDWPEVEIEMLADAIEEITRLRKNN